MDTNALTALIAALATQYSVGGISILIVIGSTVAGIKKAGMSSKWLPIISQVIGAIIGGVAAYTTGQVIIYGLMAGLVLGAATSGYYDALTSSSTKTETDTTKT